ncbi:uncharacterized protein AMSG_04013 [Thecamonas trahens ATCC 50062]|uniref:Radial spoke head 10 family protein n=1 Tax=Thecamonas trahens ATCC 50062 TaxID=461836 RepID=A0A0L0D6R9_THETB|nr:hypothetical protein AMSG_04013 [Thecamonas trahens ATCC 50062]KNC47786.1 hypothetical protein AMSG_04013 [Thecamonas trahens ATCC 50062]|eukprot:XP_013759264.1 hypothetical protein AMSG_04013 [Thecamonas trahens ATCC 50062]
MSSYALLNPLNLPSGAALLPSPGAGGSGKSGFPGAGGGHGGRRGERHEWAGTEESRSDGGSESEYGSEGSEYSHGPPELTPAQRRAEARGVARAAVDSLVSFAIDYATAPPPPLDARIWAAGIVEANGPVLDGKLEGEGEAVFVSGALYVGAFHGGLLHGSGRYTWPDGVVFTGTFEHNVITGSGRFDWPDGSWYEGEVCDGLRHGHGVFEAPALGLRYEGAWVEGLRQGDGTMSYDGSSACVYSGSWARDAKHGKGTMHYASGNVYQGEWFNNVKHGTGTMLWLSSGQQYTGEWRNGVPYGTGEHTWFVQRSARSQFMLRNKYVGAFVDGARHGFGTFTYASGAVYKGSWRANVKHGRGVFAFEDGTVFDGTFDNDRMVDASGNEITRASLNAASPLNRASHSLLSSSSIVLLISDLSSMLILASLQALAEPGGKPPAIPSQARLERLSTAIQTQLQNALLRHISHLRRVYKYYSMLGTFQDDAVYHMDRFLLWKLLVDAGIPSDAYSLADIDRLLAKPYAHSAIQAELYTQPHAPHAVVLLRDFLNTLVRIALFRLMMSPPDPPPAIALVKPGSDATWAKLLAMLEGKPGLAFESFIVDHVARVLDGQSSLLARAAERSAALSQLSAQRLVDAATLTPSEERDVILARMQLSEHAAARHVGAAGYDGAELKSYDRRSSVIAAPRASPLARVMASASSALNKSASAALGAGRKKRSSHGRSAANGSSSKSAKTSSHKKSRKSSSRAKRSRSREHGALASGGIGTLSPMAEASGADGGNSGTTSRSGRSRARHGSSRKSSSGLSRSKGESGRLSAAERRHADLEAALAVDEAAESARNQEIQLRLESVELIDNEIFAPDGFALILSYSKVLQQVFASVAQQYATPRLAQRPMQVTTMTRLTPATLRDLFLAPDLGNVGDVGAVLTFRALALFLADIGALSAPTDVPSPLFGEDTAPLKTPLRGLLTLDVLAKLLSLQGCPGFERDGELNLGKELVFYEFVLVLAAIAVFEFFAADMSFPAKLERVFVAILQASDAVALDSADPVVL